LLTRPHSPTLGSKTAKSDINTIIHLQTSVEM